MIMLHIGVSILSDSCTTLDSNKSMIDCLLATISYFFSSNITWS